MKKNKARPANVQFEELLGPAWKDVWTNGRYLFLPGWRAGWSVEELRAMWWDLQELRRLRYRIAELEGEIERRAGEQERLERDCAFYRRQLRLESRMGMMLAAIAAA